MSSSKLCLWPTVCEQHWNYLWKAAYVFFPCDWQDVSNTAHFVKGSLITSFWPTGREWHCTFCKMQSDHIFSYDQQEVSDNAHFVKGSLITYFLMTNSLWVTLHILWKAVWSHLFLWSTACEWHSTHCMKGSLIISFPMTNSLWVTLHILSKLKGSLLTSFPMTNFRKWVIVWHILCKASHHILFLWPTACEWHCTFYEKQSHWIFSYDQQHVSVIAHWMKGSLITSFPMTNSLWVTLHSLSKAVSSHLVLCPIACEWHCTVSKRQSHHIFSSAQQGVSDTAHFMRGSLHIFSYAQQLVSDIAHVKGSLLTSLPMTNSKWVIFHIQSQDIFSYDQQQVSDIAHFVTGSLITSSISND